MKCPYCHGKGSRHVVDQALKLCLYCQGTGKIEPTHQEFIQNCTTEELAEWVKNVTRHCYACGYDMARNGLQTKTKCPFGRCVADDAESWPKEKKE